MVVFVGPGLDCMEHVAATLGERGVATAWIGYPYSWPVRLRVRLFTDAVRSATSPRELADAIASLGAHRVVDVISSETTMAATAEAVRMLQREGTLADEVAADVTTRAEWVDKLVAVERLNAAGVLVSEQLRAEEVSAAEAVAKLGLPLVVKGRNGFAGSTVRVVKSEAAARRAAEKFAKDGGAYYERMVPGVEHAWVCSYGPDGKVQQEGAYRSFKAPDDPNGPPLFNRPVDLPALSDSGRRTVAELGGRGLLNLDFIVDDAGRAWLLDVNLRPWNSTVALRAAGVDFVAGYLYALGLGPAPQEPLKLPVGGEVRVFPREAAEGVLRKPVSGSRALATQARQWLPWTSPGYIAAAVLRSFLVIAVRLYRDVMGERHWAVREQRALEAED